jgi:hypothetical protein
MWWQDHVILAQISGSIRAQSVPGAEKVNEKGLP